MYKYLEKHDLIRFEQKGYRALTRGTKDHLMLDKATMKDSRYRKTNLAMTWINYQKAFDMVPHSWIVKSLEMIGPPIIMMKFLENSMAQWETNIEQPREKLSKIKNKRGKFQGDSLSPLIFVIALIALSVILKAASMSYKFKMDLNSIISFSWMI